jgi:hypothetical protein
MIFPETCKARPCRWKRAVPLPLPAELEWRDHLPFAPLGLGKESFRLKLSSKVSAASKEHPFLPLKPLISRVEPDEKSCSRCRSVSSLFRKRRNTSSPHPSRSHFATLDFTTTLPALHLGQVKACDDGSGNLRRNISPVTFPVYSLMESMKLSGSRVRPSIRASALSHVPVSSASATIMSFTDS